MLKCRWQIEHSIDLFRLQHVNRGPKAAPHSGDDRTWGGCGRAQGPTVFILRNEEGDKGMQVHSPYQRLSEPPYNPVQ